MKSTLNTLTACTSMYLIINPCTELPKYIVPLQKKTKNCLFPKSHLHNLVSCKYKTKKEFDGWKCDWQPSIRYYLGFRQVYFQWNDLVGITRRNKKSREKTVAVGWTNGRTDGRTTTFRDELLLHAVRKSWGRHKIRSWSFIT